MEITFNGLKDFPKQKELLLQISGALKRCAKNEIGSLGDVTSLIRTSMSSLDLLASNLSKEAAKQKTANQSNQ